MSSRIWRLALVLGLLGVAGYAVLPAGGLGKSLCFDLFPAAAVVAILVAVRRYRPPHPLPWVLLAASQALFLGGDVTFAIYEHVLDEPPFPSVADVFYLSGYPVLAAGLLLFLRRRLPGRDWASVLDAAIVTSSLVVLLWGVFLVEPLVDDPSLPTAAVLISVAYPLADVVLLAVALGMLSQRRSGSTPLLLVVSSLAFLLAADTAHAGLNLTTGYEPDGIVSLGRLLSYVLIGVAALHPEMGRIGEAAAGAERPFSSWRFALLGGALLAGPASFIAHVRDDPHHVVELASGTVGLGALVLFRLLGVVRRHERAVARERVLRKAGAQLAGAVSHEEIWSAGARSAHSLAGRGTGAFLALGPAGRFTVVSVAGSDVEALAGCTLPRLPAETWSELASCRFVAAPVGLCRKAGLEPAHETYLFPVVFRGELHGILGLVSASPPPPGLRDGEQTLAFEIAFALERKALELELRRQASQDTLTGLPNRYVFDELLRHALARRRPSPAAILYVDLDDFKSVNDDFGHAVGDAVLVEAAARLRESVRAGDTAARLGGDEFVVLVEELSEPADTIRLAERILRELEAPYVVDGEEIVRTASVGIAIADARDGTGDQLVRAADLAMYEAKRAGGGRFALYDAGASRTVQRRLEVRGELRSAIERRELVLHYQPVVDLESGAIVGFEALVRWRHPTRGLVLPGEFVPVAEETGLIVPLGRFVLAEACRQASEWRRDHPAASPMWVSVNVSMKEIGAPGLVDAVSDALAGSGLDPRSLVLELTESVIVGDGKALLRRLEPLKALGVRLALDDFGTGYSALGSLRWFPFDIVKIDKQFVDDLVGQEKRAHVTETMIGLGRKLGLEVVAEGIEQQEQAERLLRLGCALGQGFHYSPALPPEEIEPLLAGRGRLDAAVA